MVPWCNKEIFGAVQKRAAEAREFHEMMIRQLRYNAGYILWSVEALS